MGVEDFADFLGKVGKVSAVQADAVSVRVGIIDAALLEGTDGVEDTALEGVLSVYQEDQVFSHVGLDVVHEGLMLTFHGTAV